MTCAGPERPEVPAETLLLDHSNEQKKNNGHHRWSTGGSRVQTELLRDAPGEVDACQVLGGGDRVSEDRTISWEELDNVGGQTAVPQDFVDGVAGRDSGVTWLPQDNVPLKDTSSRVTRVHVPRPQSTGTDPGPRLTTVQGQPIRCVPSWVCPAILTAVC